MFYIKHCTNHPSEHAGSTAFWFSKRSHLQPVEWPQVTASASSDRKWIILPSRSLGAARSRLQPLEWPEVTASDRKSLIYFLPSQSSRSFAVTCSDRKRPQVTAGDPKWPQVTGQCSTFLEPTQTHGKAPQFLGRNEAQTLKGEGWLETKEAGPDIRRERLETKEGISKPKDVWKAKGALHPHHARSLLWDEKRWF